jgi:hypothetical protein
MSLTKYFYLLGFGALLLLGLALVLVSGNNYTSERIIKLSGFNTTDELIYSAQVRLLEEFREFNLIIVGTESPAVIEAWLRVTKLHPEVFQYKHLVIDPTFGKFEGAEYPDRNQIIAKFAQPVSEKVLMFLPTHEAFIDGANSVVSQIKIPFTSFMHTGLSTSKETEDRLIWKCRTSEQRLAQGMDLGCSVLQISRMQYRKVSKISAPILGLVEKIFDQQYLILQNSLVP